MDFVTDELICGSRIRILTIVDNFTRESPHIVVGKGLKGHDVVKALDEAIKMHGKPQTIKVDNGPGFISKDLDLWSYCNKVKLDFSRWSCPIKPDH